MERREKRYSGTAGLLSPVGYNDYTCTVTTQPSLQIASLQCRPLGTHRKIVNKVNITLAVKNEERKDDNKSKQ